MSEKIDQFCDKLKADLNGVESKLNDVKTRIATSQKEGRAAVEARVAEVKASVEAKKQEVEAAKAKAKNRLEEKKAETDGKIAEWKANREQHKLEKRAERSEDYAAACIVIAADSVGEAELATLEAIEARLLAEEFAAGRS